MRQLSLEMTEAKMSFFRFKNGCSIVWKSELGKKNICCWYLMFLMLSTRKHTLQDAARFSGLDKSQFSRWLKNHSDLAVYNLNQLSKKQAKQFSRHFESPKGVSFPWSIMILIDSTIHGRSTLHTDNAKKFNHGKGFVIGHQWTNIVLLLHDMIIPLPPIPFYSRRYCRENDLTYRTENAAVVEYIQNMDLEQYVGPHKSHEVVVLADSGYDDRKIQNAIVQKKWAFVIALKKEQGRQVGKNAWNNAYIQRMVPGGVLLQKSSQGKMGNRSSLFEYSEQKANGISHPKNHCLSPLRGTGSIDLLRIQKEAKGPQKIPCLQ